jgi:hypothetical protein
MSQEQAWTLEEMARGIQAERLAAAEKYRRVTAVPGSYTSPRTVLAQLLRSLAALLDGEAKPQPKLDPKPERRLVRAY